MNCACCGRKKGLFESFENLDTKVNICVECSKKLYKYQDCKKEGNDEECKKLLSEIRSDKNSAEFNDWLKTFLKRFEDTNTGIEPSGTNDKRKNAEKKHFMKMKIGEKEVPVAWETNDSVKALKKLLPLAIQMSMYGGFEQVGPLGKSIVKNDEKTTTDYGDIVLYSGNQIVVFYGSNTWSYTRLGHVELSKKEIKELLSNGDVMISISEE